MYAASTTASAEMLPRNEGGREATDRKRFCLLCSAPSSLRSIAAYKQGETHTGHDARGPFWFYPTRQEEMLPSHLVCHLSKTIWLGLRHLRGQRVCGWGKCRLELFLVVYPSPWDAETTPMDKRNIRLVQLGKERKGIIKIARNPSSRITSQQSPGSPLLDDDGCFARDTQPVSPWAPAGQDLTTR
jgi:hypothetical protein